MSSCQVQYCVVFHVDHVNICAVFQQHFHDFFATWKYVIILVWGKITIWHYLLDRKPFDSTILSGLKSCLFDIFHWMNSTPNLKILLLDFRDTRIKDLTSGDCNTQWSDAINIDSIHISTISQQHVNEAEMPWRHLTFSSCYVQRSISISICSIPIGSVLDQYLRNFWYTWNQQLIQSQSLIQGFHIDKDQVTY